MKAARQHPRFTWQLTNPYNEPYGWIKDGGRVVHNITNLPEFYLVLSQSGYKKSITALAGHQFKTEITDDDDHSDGQVQEALLNYLRKHASRFNE